MSVSHWIVRQAPFSGRFIAAKVKPHPKLDGTFVVVGDNKFDVHDDVCTLIKQFGGTPPEVEECQP